MSGSHQLPQWADALWLGLLAVYVLAGAALVPFHGDEATQIYMGRDYYYLAEADLSKILYDHNEAGSPTEQQLRLINGTVAKTIYGWIAASQGLPLDELNEQWDWEGDYAYNRDTHRIPNRHLLRLGRLASAFQLAVAVAAFFCFVKPALGRPSAYLAAALLALHPVILLNGRRAMMEGSHLLGMTLVLLAGIWLMRARKWWTYPALGMAAGFAIAAKHPNVIVAALVFFACFSYALVQAMRERRGIVRTLGGFLAAGLSALLVFYALNPAWWESPLQSASQVLSLRLGLLQGQTDFFDGYASLAERMNGFFRYGFVGEIQYFEAPNWAGYDAIRAQIGVYESSGLAGMTVGGSSPVGLLFLLLTLLGGIHLIRSGDIPWAYRWLFIAWGVGIAAITFITTPLPWARYYLAVLPFVASMTAYSLWLLAVRIWKGIKAQDDGFIILD